MPKLVRPATWSAGDLLKLGQLPRLVPQGPTCKDVYLYVDLPDQINQEIRTAFQSRWHFVGRLNGPGPAKLRLLYPAKNGPLPPTDPDLSPLVPVTPYREMTLTVSFDRADSTPMDLRKLWATARASQFSILETQAPSFSFHSMARELTQRKYGVKVPSLTSPGSAELTPLFARLYETATDATILAAAAQARRLRNPGMLAAEQRTIDIATLPRLDLPERNWDKLLGDAQIEPEPLAKLIPRDNLYVHFKSVLPVVEVLDLFTQINQTGFQEVEGNSRDYQIQSRYERMVAVQLASLTRLFGPAVVRNVAVTASDPYIREGIDMTAVFQVANRTLFYLSHDTFIQLVRREFGPDLRQAKETYQGVVIESYVTPRREISLYRTTFGEYVVLSNSLVGMKRIIDTSKGLIPSMADAPEFRYYRSVYPFKDTDEDVFVFLSTAFQRRILGAETFTKRRRRLEAFTSLYMTSNAALFAALETGVLPRDHAALMAQSGLRAEDLAFPDGSVFWDGARQQAVSNEFNNFNFATPTIEMSMGKISAREEQEYRQALQGFRSILGKTLEPLAVRLKINDKQVRAEVALAPLPQLPEVRSILDNAGGGTVPLALGHRGSETVLVMLAHLAPAVQAYFSRQDLLGDWAYLRLDDTDLLMPTAEAWIRQELDPKHFDAMQLQGERIVFQLPLVIGVGVKNQKNFDQFLRDSIDLMGIPLGPFERRKAADHKGTPVTRLQADRDSWLAETLNPGVPRDKRLLPTVWYAYRDGGWYASFRESLLHDTLDRVTAPRNEPSPPEGVNAFGFVGPGMAVKGQAGANFYLEWVNHRRALVNESVWGSLFRTGLLPEDLNEPIMRSTALRLLSFNPVSPEGALYSYDVDRDEVINRRHGTLRQPRLYQTRDEASPLNQLLKQFRTVRAEVRFRADGLHAIVDVERRR